MITPSGSTLTHWELIPSPLVLRNSLSRDLLRLWVTQHMSLSNSIFMQMSPSMALIPKGSKCPYTKAWASSLDDIKILPPNSPRGYCLENLRNFSRRGLAFRNGESPKKITVSGFSTPIVKPAPGWAYLWEVIVKSLHRLLSRAFYKSQSSAKTVRRMLVSKESLMPLPVPSP